MTEENYEGKRENVAVMHWLWEKKNQCEIESYLEWGNTDRVRDLVEERTGHWGNNSKRFEMCVTRVTVECVLGCSSVTVSWLSSVKGIRMSLP